MTAIDLQNKIFKRKETLITKAVEDELIIITMDDHISDIDSAIYTLNTTGKTVWDKIDGCRTVGTIIKDLALEYDVKLQILEKDVIKIIKTFSEKNLIY